MKKLTIGVSIQLITDMIGRKALIEGCDNVSYETTKKQIQRLSRLDYETLDEKEKDNYMRFTQTFDTWLLWAKTQGYLFEFQRVALVDFYLMLSEGASYNIPIDKNMAEHFFCFIFSKVLHSHLTTYLEYHKDEDKYTALGTTLARFDIWSVDESYKIGCNPMTGCLYYLTHFFKDINSVIKYWENKIDINITTPIEIKSAFKRWRNGRVPSWALIKLFFEKDMAPPQQFYVDDDDIKEGGFRSFQSLLITAYFIINLFDSLRKQHILSSESCRMIKDGMRLYYREFFLIRNKENTDYSDDIEKEAKSNLMFRTLFGMLDGNLSEVDILTFLNLVYINPMAPFIL